jgi:acetyl esterase
MAALDGQAQQIVDAMSAVLPGSLSEIPLEQARALANAPRPGDPVGIESVRDRDIPAGSGSVPIRVYDHRRGDPGAPLVLYFHGGGWILGGLNTADGLCRALARDLGAVVVSVDYPLAPEHPFPAAPDACFAAYQWALEAAAEWGIEAGRIAVAGDSAGANLAAAVCLMARDRGLPQPAFQWLIYPATRFTDRALASMKENADAPVLTADDVDHFFRSYIPQPADRTHAYAAPAEAPDHRGLAPALIQVAECDPLRDDGARYGEQLLAAGIPVTVTCYDGVPHGFLSWTGVHPQADRALAEAVAMARARLPA